MAKKTSTINLKTLWSKKYFRKGFKTLVFVLIASGVYAAMQNGNGQVYNYAVVERGNLKETLLVSGSVTPVNSVDLAFEVSGKVKTIEAKVGDTVTKGQTLVTLELGELSGDLSRARAGVELAYAEVRQVQAALASEQALLDELRRGTRPEEIAVSAEELDSAKKELTEAQNSLMITESKAEADLREKYENARTSLPYSANLAKSALVDLTVLQYGNFNPLSENGIKIAQLKEKAIYTLFGISQAGAWNVQAVSDLQGGLFGETSLALSKSEAELETFIARMITALYDTRFALENVPLMNDLDTSERGILQTNLSNLNLEINKLSSLQEAISTQKTLSAQAVASAKSALVSAQNKVQLAERKLALKKAGSTPEQIRSQEAKLAQQQAQLGVKQAQLRQAQAGVENIQAQIAKRSLASPIEGILTKQEAKLGEIVSPNKLLVSVITERELEIEALVPEVHIAKIHVGDLAEATLDAYGPDARFPAEVVSIDPAETILEGLPTYKVTFVFLESDSHVRSGMTANVSVITNERNDVLMIPIRAIRREADLVRVQVLPVDFEALKKPVLEWRLVETGLLGSNGYIEVTSGLEEGERVLIAIELAAS